MNTRQIQNLLDYLGYAPGKIDGLDGTNTRKAAKAFQGDFGGVRNVWTGEIATGPEWSDIWFVGM